MLRLVFLLSFPALAAAHPFKVPDGWVELTSGVPETNFAGVPPQSAAQIRAGHDDFVAADVAHATPTFLTNAAANLQDKPVTVDEDFIAKVAVMPANPAPGVTLRVREAKVADIGGVRVGRLIVDVDSADRQVTQLQYILPMGQRAAFLMYTTTRERYASYEPVFDAAARATVGIAAAETPMGRIGRSAIRGAVFGGVAAAVGVPLFALFRRRRTKKR